MLFDARGEHSLLSLWDRLEDAGVPTLRSHTHRRHSAHLSYTVLVDWDLAAVRDAVAALEDRGPVRIEFQALGTFPRGRICLVPAVPPDLMQRQQAVNQAVIEVGATVHRHYRTGGWLPHCSLAPRARLEQLPGVIAAVNDVLPLHVTADRAALIDSATGEQWPLPHVP